MAILNMKPGSVEIEADVTTKLNSMEEPARETPGGLWPIQARSYELDEFRLMAGWPVSIPTYDVRCATLISGDGEILTDRDDTTALTTGAAYRWIADPTTYDETALRWAPSQGSGVYWQTSVDYAPTLITDYEYRVESERFYATALNFDSDSRSHMWLDLNGAMSGSSGYTVVMVLSPNSVYGNNVAVPYNGLWCPGGPTPVGDTFVEALEPHWISVTLQGRYLWVETEDTTRTRGVAIAPELNSNAPLYLAMVLGRPETLLYAASGPSSIRVKALPTGDGGVPLDPGVVLGRSTGDVLHTADMALMDIGLYANRLTAAEVRDEFAILSRAYGGDA